MTIKAEGPRSEPTWRPEQTPQSTLVSQTAPASRMPPVQRAPLHRFSELNMDPTGEVSGEVIRQAATRGIQTPSGPLPYQEQLQRLFGRFDLGAVKAHVNPEAASSARAMNARAYTAGDHVVFDGVPDLRTVAHEAGHVVQQRAGIQLLGGIGQVGDEYEQHADAVADRVMSGRSAENLLDRFGGKRESQSLIGGSNGSNLHAPVQLAKYTVKKKFMKVPLYNNDFKILLNDIRGKKVEDASNDSGPDTKYRKESRFWPGQMYRYVDVLNTANSGYVDERSLQISLTTPPKQTDWLGNRSQKAEWDWFCAQQYPNPRVSIRDLKHGDVLLKKYLHGKTSATRGQTVLRHQYGSKYTGHAAVVVEKLQEPPGSHNLGLLEAPGPGTPVQVNELSESHEDGGHIYVYLVYRKRAGITSERARFLRDYRDALLKHQVGYSVSKCALNSCERVVPNKGSRTRAANILTDIERGSWRNSGVTAMYCSELATYAYQGTAEPTGIDLDAKHTSPYALESYLNSKTIGDSLEWELVGPLGGMPAVGGGIVGDGADMGVSAPQEAMRARSNSAPSLSNHEESSEQGVAIRPEEELGDAEDELLRMEQNAAESFSVHGSVGPSGERVRVRRVSSTRPRRVSM